jgi:hypothetical protein
VNDIPEFAAGEGWKGEAAIGSRKRSGRRNRRGTIQTENSVSLSFFPGGSFAMSSALFADVGITIEQSVSFVIALLKANAITV